MLKLLNHNSKEHTAITYFKFHLTKWIIKLYQNCKLKKIPEPKILKLDMHYFILFVVVAFQVF